MFKKIVSVQILLIFLVSIAHTAQISDFIRVIGYVEDGEIEMAENILNEIVTDEGSDAELVYIALEMDEAIGIGSCDFECIYIYGKALLGMYRGSYDEAIELIKEGDFEGRLRFKAMETLGVLYQKSERWEEAIEVYEELYKMSDDERKPWYLYYQYQIYTIIGDDKRVGEVIKKLEKEYPLFMEAGLKD
ncbi:MAG: hypothetical protein DRH51_04085 [Candidatus Coatesbacteria bacterium]|nr:MAG: hypothetical protein DRH51_04085 [Candidatus Coatesbacteria bacterium]